jgi:hypothetical protein
MDMPIDIASSTRTNREMTMETGQKLGSYTQVDCVRWIDGNPEPGLAVNILLLRDRAEKVQLPGGRIIEDRRQMPWDFCLWTGSSWVGGGSATRHALIPSEANLDLSFSGPAKAIALINGPIKLPRRVLPAGHYIARQSDERAIEVYVRIPEARQMPERCWVEIGEKLIAGWAPIPMGEL